MDRVIKAVGCFFFNVSELHRSPEFKQFLKEAWYPRAEKFCIVATLLFLSVETLSKHSVLHLIVLLVIAILWAQRNHARQALHNASLQIAEARAILSPYTTSTSVNRRILYSDSIEVDRILTKAHGITRPDDQLRTAELLEADEKQARFDNLRDLMKRSETLEHVR